MHDILTAMRSSFISADDGGVTGALDNGRSVRRFGRSKNSLYAYCIICDQMKTWMNDEFQASSLVCVEVMRKTKKKLSS
jgi:hypothetical protein